MAERFLILGTTGVAKDNAIRNVREYAEKQSIQIEFENYDFESDFVLKKNKRLKMHSYLDADKERQRLYWLNGWKCFGDECKDVQGKNILLCLHGVLTRLVTGSYSPIDLNSIINFRPTRIITLIDDVYLKWYRTEKRAGGSLYKGTPTLEQLLDARRTETFLSDFIADHVNPTPLNYILATHHTARSLYRLLFVKDIDLTTIYLSFPITGPRDLLKEKGDNSGISEVNEFIKTANNFEKNNPKVVCFCPLTIDEFPLLQAPKITEGEKRFKVFQIADRWNIKEFYQDEILLSNNEDIPPKTKIPYNQVSDAEGYIRRDVALRDYRLVVQSDRLAVFNPVFNGELTSGVRNEIRLATRKNIPCHIYQDPKYDSNGEAVKNLNPPEGSLGAQPYSDYVKFHNSIDELFENII